MKELIEQVIQMGNYDLTQLLDTIDRYHIEGRLSDDERMELYMTARKGAEPDYDYKGEIDALWAAIRELQKTVAPPGLTRNGRNSCSPPTRAQPTRWATKVTFRGERYVCILAHCVWVPRIIPPHGRNNRPQPERRLRSGFCFVHMETEVKKLPDWITRYWAEWLFGIVAAMMVAGYQQ